MKGLFIHFDVFSRSVLFTAVAFILSYTLSSGQDVRPPTIVCSFSKTVIQPQQEMSPMVPARTFNGGSFDDQTPPELLRFAYSNNPDDSLKYFDCSKGQFGVPIFVFDTAGNYNDCFIFVLTNIQHCQSFVLSGNEEDTIAPTGIFHPYELTLNMQRQDTVLRARAQRINAGSIDDQTPHDKLRYSFSSRADDTLRLITCARGTVQIYQVWVWDEAGNRTPGTLQIRLSGQGESCGSFKPDNTPPALICPDTVSFDISGDTLPLRPSDIYLSVSDNILPASHIAVVFKDQSSLYELSVSCDDLGIWPIALEATDFQGNYSTCTVEVHITDTADICSATSVRTGSLENTFKVYPNPASGESITIESSEQLTQGSSLVIEVFNLLGQMLYREDWLYSSRSRHITFPGTLSTGSYFMIIRSDHGSSVVKFVVK